MIVHLNGTLTPRGQARIDPFDRGFLFGDGLYEGLRAFSGRVVDMPRHVARLRRGLAEARIPFDAAAMGPLTDELLKANGLRDAFIYWQITRGVPGAGQPVRSRTLGGDVRPTVFGYCVPAPALGAYPPVPAKSAAIVRDDRWQRGHVKSVSLVASVMAAHDAADAGAEDAIMVRPALGGAAYDLAGHPALGLRDDDLVSEATSANVIAVLDAPGTAHGVELVTPDLRSTSILAGVTRDILMDACAGADGHANGGAGGAPGPWADPSWDGPVLVERPLTLRELRTAREVMIAGTLSMITAITRLDGAPVGDGAPGPWATRLLKTLCAAIAREQASARHGSGATLPAGAL